MKLLPNGTSAAWRRMLSSSLSQREGWGFCLLVVSVAYPRARHQELLHHLFLCRPTKLMKNHGSQVNASSKYGPSMSMVSLRRRNDTTFKNSLVDLPYLNLTLCYYKKLGWIPHTKPFLFRGTVLYSDCIEKLGGKIVLEGFVRWSERM